MDAKKFNKLVKGLRDSEANFNILYRHYFVKIVTHIFVQFGSYQLAEDVGQAFFAKIFEMKFEKNIDFPTAWIFTCCDNLAKDMLTKQNREFPVEDTESFSSRIDNRYTSNNVMDAVIFGDYLAQINRLEPIVRDIILMHAYEGYSLREISDILDLNYEKVRKIYSRGVKKLA